MFKKKLYFHLLSVCLFVCLFDRFAKSAASVVREIANAAEFQGLVITRQGTSTTTTSATSSSAAAAAVVVVVAVVEA
jgi:hypothetical protein